jgi:hypothetical protein
MSRKYLSISNVIDAVESALKGDNRHSESITDKWDAIEKFIQPKDRLKAAKALADAFDCNWEDNLQYIFGDEE